MNKKLLIIAFISVFAFGSCTQEYICQCEVVYEGNQPGLPDPIKKEHFIKDTHDNASKLCEDNSTTHTSDGGIKMTETCQLF